MDLDPPPSPSNAGSSDTELNAGLTDNRLVSFPRKRPLRQDDPFFQEGAYEYKAAWLRLEDADAYIPDMIDAEDETTSRLYLTAAQACYQDKCHGEQTFSSATAYEHHYETNHRHICQNCRKTFPAEKWLELHIHEVHDIMVRIRRERGEKTYQCFVDGCDRLCSSLAKRRRHVIDKHHYPRWFNFDIVLTGVIPFGERMKQVQREKALWRSRLQHQQNTTRDTGRHHQPSTLHQQDVSLQHMAHAVSGGECHDTMDMELSPTTPAANQSRRHNSWTLGLGLDRGNSARLPPKRNAFKQYRTTQLAIPKKSIVMDQSMETDTVAAPSGTSPSALSPVVTSIEEIDMEIEQLQQNMARLMVPRSVAHKMHGSSVTTLSKDCSALKLKLRAKGQRSASNSDSLENFSFRPHGMECFNEISEGVDPKVIEKRK
ncbi:hypothetical protein EDD11_002657 [Mortierella claussenii]|nr:hypothetical protein EDD11_002657 [Mortierella claussenii]